MPVRRMQKPCIQIRFVAEQKQPLTFRIEPPDRIDARRESKLGKRPMPRAVRRKLRNDAEWFVEGEKQGATMSGE